MVEKEWEVFTWFEVVFVGSKKGNQQKVTQHFRQLINSKTNM